MVLPKMTQVAAITVPNKIYIAKVQLRKLLLDSMNETQSLLVVSYDIQVRLDRGQTPTLIKIYY